MVQHEYAASLREIGEYCTPYSRDVCPDMLDEMAQNRKSADESL